MRVLEHYAPQIAEHVIEHRDDAACRKLWADVMKQTLYDLQYIARFRGMQRWQLQKHEIEKLRRIFEEPPADFVESDWFEDVCDYLDVDPAVLRARLRDEMEGAA